MKSQWIRDHQEREGISTNKILYHIMPCWMHAILLMFHAKCSDVHQNTESDKGKGKTKCYKQGAYVDHSADTQVRRMRAKY